MVVVAGISAQVGAALIAGVFALLQSALTLYIVNRSPRRQRDEDRRVINVEHGGVPDAEDGDE